MSKLVYIGNMIYIPADTITKVTGPHQDGYGVWYCVIGYKYFDELLYHTHYFSKTFVTIEDKAKEFTNRIVDRINESR